MTDVKVVGRRVYNTEAFQAGEYGLIEGYWYACTPNGELGNLFNHEVVEHEDGTITVSPSILVSSYDSKGNAHVVWHGFLEHGVWREV